LLRRGRLLYGGDYNPEQWPEETWAEDARLMREAGVNLVTVGVFSWALLEPAPGEYDFAWLDRVIDLLWSHDVAIDLATPSAAPPAWLVRQHPEILPVTADGVRLEFGSRRHTCPSSGAYRDAAVRIAEQLARRYGRHDAIALWHVSNEYGCHLPACYCVASAEHFRHWLRERYGDVESLNDAWGTAFWGQRYGDLSEIEPPRRTPASVNPAQALDWARFSSDAWLECYEAEREVLTDLAPGIPVTTNFMSLFKPIDAWTWSAREDVVTLDSYPDPADPEAHVAAALNYDLMRSLAGGQPWLLLEHATSAVNWREVNVPKRHGQMRLWAYQAVARGSDGALFFQWRASRSGAEKFHSAMLPHLGTHARGWTETVRLGRELGALGAIAGTTVRAESAFLLDWESWWALEGADHPSQVLDLPALLLAYYRPFFAANVPVDFVHPEGDLGRYRLVVAPNLHLVTGSTLGALAAYVKAGGVFVCGFFSGLVDEHDRIRDHTGPDELHGLLGVTVDEFWPLPPGEELGVAFADGVDASARGWSEWIELDGGDPVARYSSGTLAGGPAVVRHRVGAGTAFYNSAGLDASGLTTLLRIAWNDAGVQPVAAAPDGVELCRRESAESSYLFLLNHNEHAVDVDIGAAGAFELLTGTQVASPIHLDGRGVAILREIG
jgi:beta-galactosidase